MSTFTPGPLLAQFDNPIALRNGLKDEQLKQLCTELRQYIVDIVSEKGGHFGASLAAGPHLFAALNAQIPE